MKLGPVLAGGVLTGVQNGTGGGTRGVFPGSFTHLKLAATESV